MFVQAGGKDLSAELGPVLRERARALREHEHAPRELDEVCAARSLCRAESDAEFLDRFVALLWHKTGVSTQAYYIPRRPGPLGTLMAAGRRLLWKLLRYQHDRIAWQQNMINTQLTMALELVHTSTAQELAQLRRRVAELEARPGAGA